MLKKVLLLTVMSSVVAVASTEAQAAKITLQLVGIQRAAGGLVHYVTMNAALTNYTKVVDAVAVNVTLTVVCPFRPDPIVVKLPFSVTLNPGQSINRRITLPIPHPKLLAPLNVTVKGTAWGTVSKTWTTSTIWFKLNP